MLLPLFVSAGCLIYYYLLPSSSVSKTARAVISVAALSAVCLPLFGMAESAGAGEFYFREQTGENLSPYDFYEEAARKTTENTVAQIVKKYTAVPFVCSADVRTGEDGAVEILRIRLTFESLPERENAMKEELIAQTGLVPEIRVK